MFSEKIRSNLPLLMLANDKDANFLLEFFFKFITVRDILIDRICLKIERILFQMLTKDKLVLFLQD